ncbi:MAG: hypothetical protein ACYDEX_21170 [Mobilitalea sp.]
MMNNQFENLRSNSRLKKHFCPNCCEPLKTLTIGNIVNTQSSNSSTNDAFPFSGSNMYGTMTSYSTHFQCQKCRIRYKAEDIKKLEQNNYKFKLREAK